MVFIRCHCQRWPRQGRAERDQKVVVDSECTSTGQHHSKSSETLQMIPKNTSRSATVLPALSSLSWQWEVNISAEHRVEFEGFLEGSSLTIFRDGWNVTITKTILGVGKCMCQAWHVFFVLKWAFDIDRLFNILITLTHRWCILHSRGEETEAQCSDASCPRPHTESVLCWRFGLFLSDLKV